MIVHSFRYLLFGKQILDRGSIYDYRCANSYYYQVIQDSEIDNANDWKEIEVKYKYRVYCVCIEFQRPIQQQLLDDAFPKSIDTAEFLDEKEPHEPIQIAELKRFVHFPGTFVGQEYKAILEIIRLSKFLLKNDNRQ
jgi:hypothetical protein